MMGELRDIIRQVLAEEILALRQNIATSQAETVQISNDDDLNNFARMIMRRAQDPEFASRLNSGEALFALKAETFGIDTSTHEVAATRQPEQSTQATPYALAPIPQFQRNIVTSDYQANGAVRQAATPTNVASPSAIASLDIAKKLITESDLDGLAPKSRVRIAKSAVLTPLAKDEIRRRGISIERTPS